VYLPLILKIYPLPVPTPTPTTTPTPEPCYPQVVTVVPVGVSPRGVAVDSTNNRIYVANHTSGSVSVIDGTTHAASQIAGVPGANGIAYDGTNGRVYVTNRENGSLTIIETAGHTVVGMVAVGTLPNGVAYNPVTNKIYVANFGSGTVTIFNAASPAIPLATLAVPSEPSHIAVDTTTGKVYVTNHGNASVTVINGVTDSITALISLFDSVAPYGIAIDTVRHYAYVATIDSNRIVVIDTNSDTLLNYYAIHKYATLIPVPLRVIAVDSALGASGHLYATTASSNGGFDKLLVISKGHDEGLNPPFAIDTGANPVEGVALNPANHRVYVTARDANQVTVVQDGLPPCMYNFAQEYVIVKGYFPE
jgi:YVTN family beta-propeller protein